MLEKVNPGNPLHPLQEPLARRRLALLLEPFLGKASLAHSASFVHARNTMRVLSPKAELIFLKQNLKIKSFVGTSKNAGMTRIWIALYIYLLLTFLKFQSKLQKSTQQILHLLHLNLFEKRDLMALLRGDPPGSRQVNINQLVLL